VNVIQQAIALSMVATFKHIHREYNNSSKVLAKFGLSLDEGILFYIFPPTFVVN